MGLAAIGTKHWSLDLVQPINIFGNIVMNIPTKGRKKDSMRFYSFANSATRFLLLFMLVSACSEAFPQTLMPTRQKTTVDNKWDVGLNLGFTQFYGDVSSYNFLGKLKNGESGMGIQIYTKRMFNPAFGAGIDIFSTGLRSTKDKYNGKTVSYNLAGNFNDLSVFAYANFSNLFGNHNYSHKLSVYGKLGFGISTWNTSLTNKILGGVIHSGATYGNTKFANKAFSVPLGAGLDYHISNNLSVHVGGTFTTVLSDDVDLWRAGFKYDQLLFTNVGVTYYIKSGNNNRPVIGENQSRRKRRRNRRESNRHKNFIPIFDYIVSPKSLTSPQKPKVKHPVKKAQQPKPTVQFRIQILVSPKPLSDPSALQTRYKLSYPVKVVHQDGVYLYSVGHFITYQDALNGCRVILGKGVHGAFVTAYEHGRRVPLTNEMMHRGFNYLQPDQSSTRIIE